jgi:hypothetical protein
LCQRPSFGLDRPGRADGDDWRGQDRRDTARLFRAASADQGDRADACRCRARRCARSIRGRQTEFKYERGVQPAPKLGEWVEVLTEILEKEAKLPKRERRSTQRLFEELRGRGYDGAHDSVHRFVKAWRDERARVPVQAFVPMSFAPGEAYQFDWSHETITLQGCR